MKNVGGYTVRQILPAALSGYIMTCSRKTILSIKELSMDVAIECMVYRRTPFWKKPCLYLLYGLAGLSFIVASVFSLLYVVAIAFGLAAYFFRKTIDQEIDYSYYDGELRVDRVASQSTRKHLKTFQTEKIEILAPAGSARLRNFGHRNVSFLNYSGISNAEDSELYVMYYDHQYKVLLTLSEKMVKALKRAHPYNVYLDDGQNY